MSQSQETHDRVDEDALANVISTQARSLYVSHFLSTWNARTFEFAIILFTTSAYPGTLLPASIMQIMVLITSLLSSAPLGSFLDGNPRLSNLRMSIVIQRITVLLSCFIFYILHSETDHSSYWLKWKAILFGVAILLSSIENLSGKANTITMERDWVPAICATEEVTEDEGSRDSMALTRLNGAMRRIDLFCKLLAPVFITFVTVMSSRLSPVNLSDRLLRGRADLPDDLNVAGVKATILVVGCMALISPFIEWKCAEWVYWKNERLQRPKQHDSSSPQSSLSCENWLAGWKAWWKSEICLPSIALALLYMSTLSFSTSLITYLLNSSFELSTITIARFCSAIVELSATFVMPFGVSLMSKAAKRRQGYHDMIVRTPVDEHPLLGPSADTDIHHPPIPDNGAGVERMGLWGLWWQVANLVPATLLLWFQLPSQASQPVFAVTFFVFVAFSRLGLWTIDLSVSQLTQTLVPDYQRGQFSGVELSLCSLAELVQFILTASFNKSSQFRMITVGTTSAVVLSALVFSAWMWKRRGHLLHMEKVRCGHDKSWRN